MEMACEEGAGHASIVPIFSSAVQPPAMRARSTRDAPVYLSPSPNCAAELAQTEDARPSTAARRPMDCE